MTLLFLGTGTSHGVPMIGCTCPVCTSDDPRDNRTRPSVYLTLPDGAGVLIDTSPDFRMQALRHRLPRIDAVLFTHSHADHVLGLDDLRRYNHLQRGRIPCFGDVRTMADIRRTFGYIFDHATPEQIACFGVHPPGHPFWTRTTLARAHARYPNWDLTPYEDALRTTPARSQASWYSRRRFRGDTGPPDRVQNR